MEYLDEEILKAKRLLERRKYTTLETGMYAGEDKITFRRKELFGGLVSVPLPRQFVPMPESVKQVKYPAKRAPEYILTSLDTTVNFCFNRIPAELEDGALQNMSLRFQNALEQINPSIKVKPQPDTATTQGNEMCWFEYKGYQLNGQSFNRVYLIRLQGAVLHGTFHCRQEDREKWKEIVRQIFFAVQECEE